MRVGIPGLWSRSPDDARANPYLFPKLKSAITGNGDPIILPPGCTLIDWECELTIVIGATLRRVPPEEVMDHVFGYTLMLDVSDREDRLDGRYGSDWLLGKSQDTFAPLGPFVVPAAFVPDPQNLGVQFSLNDELMQDATTSLMTPHHSGSADVRVGHGDAAPWRPRGHGHPGRRGHRRRAADLPQSRGSNGVHGRGDRHAEQHGRSSERRLLV